MKKNDETYCQIFLVSFMKKLQALEPHVGMIFFSVPNGGSRNKAEAANLKLAGLTAGVPDICILFNGGSRFIELKKSKGKTSLDQNKMIEKITNLGHPVDIVFGDTPKEIIDGCTHIMLELGYSYQGISKASSSALNALSA